MPNIAAILKQEIVRISRKEARNYTAKLQKASAQFRRDIAALKRQNARMHAEIRRLERSNARARPAPTDEDSDGAHKYRFSVRSLKSQRRRLGLSAQDYGRLAGVSAATVYNWEREISKPRKSHYPALASLRGVGKKEARQRLDEK